MEEHCSTCEVGSVSLYAIQNNFSLFELHTPYSVLHQWFQNFFRFAKHLELSHCTLYHETFACCAKSKCVIV